MKNIRRSLAGALALAMLANAPLTSGVFAQDAPQSDAAQASGSSPGNGKTAIDPDWPCKSRKVVEISPAQIWDGPSLEGLENWRNDDDIRKLSEFVVARRVPVDEVENEIKKYAGTLPQDVQDQKLSMLFAGVLSRINDERKLVISGIERFNKRQLARAKTIEKEGLTLPDLGAPLPVEPVPGTEIDKISEEEDRYNWDIRVFLERQQNIPIACEIPQLIEERAGAIARAIRANMKS